jgi:hypothetical protein
MDLRESACTIQIGSVEYTVDFQTMTQRRSDANLGAAKPGGSEYAVRRWHAEWNKDTGLAWNKRIRELHPSWENQTSSLQVCPVEEGSSDFEKVARKLFDSAGSVTKETHKICRVVRVQNLETFIKYANERDSIIRRRGAGSISFVCVIFVSCA